jgi:hypothetical protein
MEGGSACRCHCRGLEPLHAIHHGDVFQKNRSRVTVIAYDRLTFLTFSDCLVPFKCCGDSSPVELTCDLQSATNERVTHGIGDQ